MEISGMDTSKRSLLGLCFFFVVVVLWVKHFLTSKGRWRLQQQKQTHTMLRRSTTKLAYAFDKAHLNASFLGLWCAILCVWVFFFMFKVCYMRLWVFRRAWQVQRARERSWHFVSLVRCSAGSGVQTFIHNLVPVGCCLNVLTSLTGAVEQTECVCHFTRWLWMCGSKKKRAYVLTYTSAKPYGGWVNHLKKKNLRKGLAEGEAVMLRAS